MRGLAFSLFLAVGVAGCGPKAPPPAGDTTGADVVLLEVTHQIQLSKPSTPLGKNLRLAAAPTGDWYVLDTDHNRLLHFDSQGNLRRESGGLGSGPLEFDTPVDIDADGLSVWVLDRQNRRVVRLDRELNYIEEMPVAAASDDLSGALWYDALALTSAGDLLLLDRQEPRVLRISPGGDLQATYGGFGLGTGRLAEPVDVASAANGDVYVADGRGILTYDRSGNFRGEAATAARAIAVAGGDDDAWAVLASGDMNRIVGNRSLRVTVDPAHGRPVPVAITVVRGRGQGPAILDLGLTVWLLAPFEL